MSKKIIQKQGMQNNKHALLYGIDGNVTLSKDMPGYLDLVHSMLPPDSFIDTDRKNVITEFEEESLYDNDFINLQAGSLTERLLKQLNALKSSYNNLNIDNKAFGYILIEQILKIDEISQDNKTKFYKIVRILLETLKEMKEYISCENISLQELEIKQALVGFIKNVVENIELRADIADVRIHRQWHELITSYIIFHYCLYNSKK